MPKIRFRNIVLVAALVLIALPFFVQISLAQFRGRYREETSDDSASWIKGEGEFHFIRVEYSDIMSAQRGFGFSSRNGQAFGWWSVDWPDADNHASLGFKRLTRIAVGEPRHLRLTDPHIFDYPWIYATQTGWWNLSKQETDILHEHLLRGGFLMTDDFWEGQQWALFEQTMSRALPSRPILDVPEDAPIMHVLFDITTKDRATFIPGSRHLGRGAGGSVQVYQPQGTTPTWRAMYDDKNRAIVAANFNMDVGDAWEFADVPWYPENMTALAYRFGLNYIIYSMTH
jgi:hypothetical protein